MKLLREGAKRKSGKTELIPEHKSSIRADYDKIVISAYDVKDSNPDSESTYDYTIELSREDFSQILKKIDESAVKHPNLYEFFVRDNTKTLFRLLMLSSGILSNFSTKEDTQK